MSKYSSSSDWSEPSSGPSLHRTRNFEYIPSTGTAASETDRAPSGATSSAESEVVDAIPSEQKSAGLFKVAVAVAAGPPPWEAFEKRSGRVSVRWVTWVEPSVKV